MSYSDNGYGCEVPPCRVSWKGSASATFTVLPSGYSGRQSLMQFAARGTPTLPFDKCVDLYGQSNYGPTYGTPGRIDITRRRPGSSHRVTAGWANGTSVEAYSNARPTTPAKLAYPMNVIYAGKPLTIRVVDTQDETKLYDSFNGVVTITLKPRRSR